MPRYKIIVIEKPATVTGADEAKTEQAVVFEQTLELDLRAFVRQLNAAPRRTRKKKGGAE